jgi:hypothetical protein
MPLWVQIPESLPTKVSPPTFMCLIKRKPPYIPVRSPKLRHNPVSVMHNPSLSTVSLLLSPQMRSHEGMAKQTGGHRLRFVQVSAPSYTFDWLVDQAHFPRDQSFPVSLSSEYAP